MRFNQVLTACSLLIGMALDSFQLAMAQFQFPIDWEIRKCIKQRLNRQPWFQIAIAHGCSNSRNLYNRFVGRQIQDLNRTESNRNAGKTHGWRTVLGGLARSAGKRTAREETLDNMAGVRVVRKPANGHDNTLNFDTHGRSASRNRSHPSYNYKWTIANICRSGFSTGKLRHQANRAATRRTGAKGSGCCRTPASPASSIALKTLFNNLDCFIADFLPRGKLICECSIIRKVLVNDFLNKEFDRDTSCAGNGKEVGFSFLGDCYRHFIAPVCVNCIQNICQFQ